MTKLWVTVEEGDTAWLTAHGFESFDGGWRYGFNDADRALDVWDVMRDVRNAGMTPHLVEA